MSFGQSWVCESYTVRSMKSHNFLPPTHIKQQGVQYVWAMSKIPPFSREILVFWIQHLAPIFSHNVSHYSSEFQFAISSLEISCIHLTSLSSICVGTTIPRFLDWGDLIFCDWESTFYQVDLKCNWVWFGVY